MSYQTLPTHAQQVAKVTSQELDPKCESETAIKHSNFISLSLWEEKNNSDEQKISQKQHEEEHDMAASWYRKKVEQKKRQWRPTTRSLILYSIQWLPCLTAQRAGDVKK